MNQTLPLYKLQTVFFLNMVYVLRNNGDMIALDPGIFMFYLQVESKAIVDYVQNSNDSPQHVWVGCTDEEEDRVWLCGASNKSTLDWESE